MDAAERAPFDLPDFEALGVVEREGRLYFPTAIRTRTAKGGTETMLEVFLTAPTQQQRYRARSAAREMATKIFKLDLEADKAEVAEVENYHLLWYSIRDRQTFSQLEESVKSMLDRFSDYSLKEVWALLNHIGDLLDPRYGEMSGEQLWRAIAAVATEGSLRPLVAMPGFEQATCIVFMARAACESPNAPSWLSSPTTLRSGSSTETSSPPSSPESDRGSDEDDG